MRIVISEFMSLDGVVQAPGGPDEDTAGGFRHGGWSMPFFEPETMGPKIDEAMATTDALLFGRRTWRAMADAWTSRAGDPFADQLTAMDKYVASRTLAEADVDWANTTLLGGEDVMDQVRTLKEQDGGDLLVMGSPTLARDLLAARLVDQLDLMIEPIVLGGGKRIFPDDGTAFAMELVESSVTGTGVHLCTYRPVAGDVATGSSDDFYE